ncbi:hypothetical protein DRE_05952 [Drechslerella stenobrocha 248]|uniref:Uncharacterized protein n=1 Tax=Drechslerella stenobrocha 248 TaxID=1043628 RepID=W7I895_9PEZI|nr:hypothetical protein DRE_05952 [Drechslerella stenobrocha 248]
MPFFSSKKKHKTKIDLTEHHRDKRKMGKNVDPTRAITEEEPWAIAQQAGKGISQLRHKDQYGNDITDPDRSNPTRHRMERPLETIRSFERAIYHDYDREFLPRRSNRNGSTYDHQSSQRASVAYQYGDQSARQSTYDNYDAGSSYSQRGHHQQQHRYSGFENGSSSRPRGEIPPDSYSGTYSNGAGSGWSSEPSSSTNPSSDSSAYANYEQQQQQQQQPHQYNRSPLGIDDKPLPNVTNQASNPMPIHYQNGYNPQPQYQQPQQQQNNSYNGHSQVAPAQNQYQQYGQQQQVPQSAWNAQPTAAKTTVTKSSAAADGKSGGEKRRSWFRRSKA